MVKIGNIEKITPLMRQWSKWSLELEVPTTKVMYLSPYSCVVMGKDSCHQCNKTPIMKLSCLDTLGFNTNFAYVISMDQCNGHVYTLINLDIP